MMALVSHSFALSSLAPSLAPPIAVAPVQLDIYALPGHIGYYVKIGFPASTASGFYPLGVTLDTGSSYFGVAGATNMTHGNGHSECNKPECTVVNSQLSVQYQAGSWSGRLVKGTLEFGGIQAAVDFVEISQAKNFFSFPQYTQGTLGMAYRGLAKDSSPVTFMDRLVCDNQVPEDVFSIQLCGISGSSGHVAGVLVLGGVESPNEKIYKGDVYYTPILQTTYYTVAVVDMGVGGASLGLPCDEFNPGTTGAIVDSGTTYLILPDAVFDATIARVQAGAREGLGPAMYDSIFARRPGWWEGESSVCLRGLLTDQQLKEAFPSLKISFGLGSINNQLESQARTFSISVEPGDYLRPVVLAGEDHADGFSEDGGDRSFTCYNLGVHRSEFPSLILGNAVMEGYHVVFDRKRKQVGFALAAAHSCPDFAHTIDAPEDGAWCQCVSAGLKNPLFHTPHAHAHASPPPSPPSGSAEGSAEGSGGGGCLAQFRAIWTNATADPMQCREMPAGSALVSWKVYLCVALASLSCVVFAAVMVYYPDAGGGAGQAASGAQQTPNPNTMTPVKAPSPQRQFANNENMMKTFHEQQKSAYSPAARQRGPDYLYTHSIERFSSNVASL